MKAANPTNPTGLSKKDLFLIDYAATMPAVLGKQQENIDNHVKLFRKPACIKYSANILRILITCLAKYIEQTDVIKTENNRQAMTLRRFYRRWLLEEHQTEELTPNDT